MTGLLETIVVLWEGVRERIDKPANKQLKKKLVSTIATSMPQLFDTFKVSSIYPFMESSPLRLPHYLSLSLSLSLSSFPFNKCLVLSQSPPIPCPHTLSYFVTGENPALHSHS